MSTIVQGKTYPIKNGKRGSDAGTVSATVTGIVKKGRGHTVQFKVGNETHTQSMAKFSARLAA